MSLEFNDTGRYHLYRLDGDRVPSVTTIVGGSMPKGGLAPWAARIVAEAVAAKPSVVDVVRELGPDALVAALRALPDQSRDAAARRGTWIHELAARLVADDEIDRAELDDDVSSVLDALRRWFDATGFEIELGELIVGNRTSRYAGRFDVIGHMAADPHVRWLIDFKSSGSVYGDTALQCAAYARAEFYVDADGTEVPMPRIDRIGVLHLQPDLAELYDLGDIDQAFAEFRAGQFLYASTSRRSALVRTPVRIAQVTR